MIPLASLCKLKRRLKESDESLTNMDLVLMFDHWYENVLPEKCKLNIAGQWIDFQTLHMEIIYNASRIRLMGLSLISLLESKNTNNVIVHECEKSINKVVWLSETFLKHSLTINDPLLVFMSHGIYVAGLAFIVFNLSLGRFEIVPVVKTIMAAILAISSSKNVR